MSMIEPEISQNVDKEEEWEDIDEEDEEEEYAYYGEEEAIDYEYVQDEQIAEEEDAIEIDEEEAKRLRAKRARAERRKRRPSAEDVDGAIKKETLRTLSNNMIQHLIESAEKEVQRLKTENHLFERTIERLEEPEKMVEEMYAMKKEHEANDSPLATANTVCDSEPSEEEPEDTGVYKAVNPIEEINVSTDSFFDNMSENSKEAALSYFRNIGVIAPANYDVMRDKYGDYVKGAKHDPKYTTKAESGDINVTKLNSTTYEAGTALIRERDKKTTESDVTKKPIKVCSRWLDDDGPQPGDEGYEVDYSDFDLSTAKQLKTEDKLTFGRQEEEELRKGFYKFETMTLREESDVQVNIDAHKHSMQLLLHLRKDFKTIFADQKHPMPQKTMAELILRLRRKMRNQIAAEETKARMQIRKVLDVNRRAAYQLKSSKKISNNISEIDFEHLAVENEIFMSEMKEMNLSLKYLKQLSSNYFHTLIEDEEQIENLEDTEKKLLEKILKNKSAYKTFAKAYQKYRGLINKTNMRMYDLKKRVSKYHAPKPMDYIRLKAENYHMESEVTALRKKLAELSTKLITIRTTFANLCHSVPQGDQTEAENEAWLKKVKEEVEANNLMSEIENGDSDEEASDFPDALKFRKNTIPHQPARSSSTKTKTTQSIIAPTIPSTQSAKENKPSIANNAGKKKSQQTGTIKGNILLAPSRAASSRKSIEKTVYDTDTELNAK